MGADETDLLQLLFLFTAVLAIMVVIFLQAKNYRLRYDLELVVCALHLMSLNDEMAKR